MTEAVMVHSISREELINILKGHGEGAEIPDIEINAKQAQSVLSCSYKTLMSYVADGHLTNVGRKKPAFKLRETVDLKRSDVKYKRFRNLP